MTHISLLWTCRLNHCCLLGNCLTEGCRKHLPIAEMEIVFSNKSQKGNQPFSPGNLTYTVRGPHKSGPRVLLMRTVHHPDCKWPIIWFLKSSILWSADGYSDAEARDLAKLWTSSGRLGFSSCSIWTLVFRMQKQIHQIRNGELWPPLSVLWGYRDSEIKPFSRTMTFLPFFDSFLDSSHSAVHDFLFCTSVPGIENLAKYFLVFLLWVQFLQVHFYTMKSCVQKWNCNRLLLKYLCPLICSWNMTRQLDLQLRRQILNTTDTQEQTREKNPDWQSPKKSELEGTS